MRNLFVVIALVVTGTSTSFAHPSSIPFDTRGQCESAMAEWNKMDRERDGEPEDYGEANRYYHENWSCVEIDGKWYMQRES